MTGRIHSFESFGTVDGPGIRFVTFMQGCPLRCLYCHNPDTWEGGGTSYSVEEVAGRVLKYKNYFGEKGGVTLSGGEPLLQIDFVVELFTLLKKKGIHTCVDTSGFTFDASNEEVVRKHEKLLEVCDLVLLDIKHIDDESHKKLTGQTNARTLQFAKFLSDKGKPMWIRHVLVPTLTDEDESLKRLKAFIDTLKTVEKVEVLPYHTMGEVKYEKLGISYPLKGVQPPEKARVDNARKILRGEDDDGRIKSKITRPLRRGD
ncbi:MAG: pyruvate formate lyase-activating protein [Clostridia bacterium]|nr:pyruvate formate lyase-activating protein [Clostridia bacterium]